MAFRSSSVGDLISSNESGHQERSSGESVVGGSCLCKDVHDSVAGPVGHVDAAGVTGHFEPELAGVPIGNGRTDLEIAQITAVLQWVPVEHVIVVVFVQNHPLINGMGGIEHLLGGEQLRRWVAAEEVVEEREVHGDQPAFGVGERKRVQQDGCNQGRNQVSDHDQTSGLGVGPFSLDEVDHERGHPRRSRLHHSVDGSEQSRVSGRPTQSFHDKRREVGKTTVRNGNKDLEPEHGPHLWVQQRFSELAPFPVLRLDTCLVLFHLMDNDGLFLLRKPETVDWTAWKQEIDNYSPSDGHSAGNPVERPPWLEPVLLVASNSIPNRTREDRGESRLYSSPFRWRSVLRPYNAAVEEVTLSIAAIETFSHKNGTRFKSTLSLAHLSSFLVYPSLIRWMYLAPISSVSSSISSTFVSSNEAMLASLRLTVSFFFSVIGFVVNPTPARSYIFGCYLAREVIAPVVSGSRGLSR
ncbi:hypothetical protein OGAPHI_006342 [Ogataea philodendri]|uniref:Uncharacterized protein n=1 Tax=Ogataea philodendri TaxID=1378263 RepID=A0A9P8NXU4_9ASCO|nr:uncharacterized protein OGAPHI_006342 [Ogataea philodendri]KAH3661495.1 hypothetical protein OGAPHI_006342 [Ogataea philodendri]